jgi:hypothetical protein
MKVHPETRGDREKSWKMERRVFLARALAGALSAFGIFFPKTAEALPITDINSPRRKRLPERLSTRFIILHTTEAESRSALRSIAQGGKASYHRGQRWKGLQDFGTQPGFRRVWPQHVGRDVESG